MAEFTLKDATCFVDDFDFSTRINTLTLTAEKDTPEITAFGDGSREFLADGLRTVTFDLAGYFEGDGADEHVGNLDSTARTAFTVTPTGADGAVAYLAQSLDATYTLLGAIGDVAPFSLSGRGRNAAGLLRGQLLLDKQDVTGNVSGTGQQMGQVAATESVYTTIHVFGAGTTADVIVESDDNGAFSSATERSNTTVTAVGGTWVAPLAGAITDDYWRVRTENVTGTFSVAVAVAIA